MIVSTDHAYRQCLTHPPNSRPACRSSLLRTSQRLERALVSGSNNFHMYLSDETPSAEAVDNSFWSVLKEALRGSHRDLTEGSIVAAIVILAIPMVLEMGMESLFAIVDIFFVAKLGANSIAVVSLTESVLALMYAVAIGVSVGATATVARRIGE